ncbi:MAG: ABC transporter ATP-binding protein, partial [Acidobacteriales bacterium]|nr:ABC transporter ATP-binding protein [Terriglobales bacterium]
MQRLLRLLRYLLPYSAQALLAVVLLAAVGLLDAFRLLLIGPVFDRVLNPHSPDTSVSLFKIPHQHRWMTLDHLVPSNFHNPWTMVAFALVASTLLKGICDYAGTYLVNFAGFGMITDLRDDLYQSILRRSARFFHSQTTATLLSTIVNDVERVQFAITAVLAEFLQQFFTFLFTAAVVIDIGGKLAWVLLLFVPFVVASS